MLDVSRALERAASSAASNPVQAPPQKLLVLGGGGALGSAVLEQLVGCGRFAQVGVLVQAGRPLRVALRGLHAVGWNEAADFGASNAIVVFDRERLSNGREEAFERPEPQALPAQAQALHAAGVQRLIVALPYDSGLLPLALMQGLASLDEAAVTKLGFTHIVFGRMADRGLTGGTGGGLSAPQRLARWMLSQLRWLTPAREAPVRPLVIAQALAALAWQLPQATEGTRILAPQWWWQCAQSRQPEATMTAWLRGDSLPDAAHASGVSRWGTVNSAGHNSP